jgi:hypothetical protein
MFVISTPGQVCLGTESRDAASFFHSKQPPGSDPMAGSSKGTNEFRKPLIQSIFDDG